MVSPKTSFNEVAVQILERGQVNGVNDATLAGYDRLYVGSSFCERLIPDVKEVRELEQRINKLDMGLTLVLPPLTNCGLRKLAPLLDFVQGLQTDTELVANDWGAAAEITGRGCALVIGRLFAKTKSDPRTAELISAGTVPASAFSYYSHSNVLDESFQSFAVALGATRVELDLGTCGLDADAILRSKMKVNLYLDRTYVSSSRRCLAKHMFNLGAECWRFCQQNGFSLDLGFRHAKMFVIGNAYFFEPNPALLNALPDGDIRLIKELPEAGIAAANEN